MVQAIFKVLLHFSALFALAFGVEDAETRRISFWNRASLDVEIFWIDDEMEGHLVSENPVSQGEWFFLTSYVHHSFEIWEKPQGADAEGEVICPLAPNQECRVCHFTVSPEEGEQGLTITQDFECELHDSRILAQRTAGLVSSGCLEEVNEGDEKASTTVMADFARCVIDRAAGHFDFAESRKITERKRSLELSDRLEGYKCEDDTSPTTTPEYVTKWEYNHTDEEDGAVTSKKYTVQVHHERPASKIHVLSDFVTPQECSAMIEAGRDTLQSARTADGKGGSQVNKIRKALQGMIQFDIDGPNRTIPNVMDRIYAYTNEMLNFNLTIEGQEVLNLIQYEGRGRNTTDADQYKPHCDGQCDGRPHKTGTRVATMVIYCQAADEGGHTNFGNVGVHVKPRAFDAVFFSYVDPKTGITDTGKTTHSGCPVYTGTKQIVTHWMRRGVSLEKPFYDFNSLGIYDPQREKTENGDVLNEDAMEAPEGVLEDIPDSSVAEADLDDAIGSVSGVAIGATSDEL